jgi:hypothetical protein
LSCLSFQKLQVSRYLPLPLLKTSFSVTNSYVLKKLRLVLFPWRHKSWSRKVSRRGMSGDQGSNGSGGVEGWMPPRDDINAPDLYIPSKRYSQSRPYEGLSRLITFPASQPWPWSPTPCSPHSFPVAPRSLESASANRLRSSCSNSFAFGESSPGYARSHKFISNHDGFHRLGCYLLDVRGSGASGVELIGYGGYKFVG